MSELIWLLTGMVAGLAAILAWQILFSITQHLINNIIENIWPPRAIDLQPANFTIAPSIPKEPR